MAQGVWFVSGERENYRNAEKAFKNSYLAPLICPSAGTGVDDRVI